jgi:hypothetical protein
MTPLEGPGVEAVSLVELDAALRLQGEALEEIWLGHRETMFAYSVDRGVSRLRNPW